MPDAGHLAKEDPPCVGRLAVEYVRSYLRFGGRLEVSWAISSSRVSTAETDNLQHGVRGQGGSSGSRSLASSPTAVLIDGGSGWVPRGSASKWPSQSADWRFAGRGLGWKLEVGGWPRRVMYRGDS